MVILMEIDIHAIYPLKRGNETEKGHSTWVVASIKKQYERTEKI